MGRAKVAWLFAAEFAMATCERGPETTPPRPPALNYPVEAESTVAEGATEQEEPGADVRHELRWRWTPGTIRRYSLDKERVNNSTTRLHEHRVWELEVLELDSDGVATLTATVIEHRFHWTLPRAPSEVAFDSTDPSFAKNIDRPLMRTATLEHGLALDVKVATDGSLLELTGSEQLETRLEEEIVAHPDVFKDTMETDLARLMLAGYDDMFTEELESILHSHTLPGEPVAPGDGWSRTRSVPLPAMLVGPIEVTLRQVASDVPEEQSSAGCLRFETTADWPDSPGANRLVTVERFSGESSGWTCFSHRSGEVVAAEWGESVDIAINLNGSSSEETRQLHRKLVLLR